MSLHTFSIIQQLFVFALGCCFGSFFNVVIHRLPNKESLVRPGSKCPHCQHPINALQNIPLVSYVFLRGKCRHCGGRISLRYPIVEGLTGTMALVLFRSYGWHPQFGIEFLFVSLLIIITFIDLDTYLIPDVLSLTGVILGFACSFFSPRLSWFDSLLGIVLGGGFFLLIALGYQYLRNKDGLGGGDIKLLGMIGAFLGWPGVVFTILVSSIVGTVVGLAWMQREGNGMSTMLPYGPFLALGATCFLFWGQDFYQWYFGLIMSSP
jgi:leader peptidase (prepilin peptidase)/N-methyltransferase